MHTKYIIIFSSEIDTAVSRELNILEVEPHLTKQEEKEGNSIDDSLRSVCFNGDWFAKIFLCY